MKRALKRFLERLKRDRETMKRLDKMKKIEFVWDYYKVPIAIVAFLVFVLVSITVSAIGRGGNIIYVAMVNTDTEPGSDNNGKAVIEEILSENGYDMTKKKASVDSNYTLSFDNATDSDIATLQVLSALFGIGDLDLFVSDKEVFDKFAVKNGFSDLRAFISTDILSANEDKIYYFEKENGESVPVAIILEEGSALHKEGLYSGTVYAGIVSRAENADTAADIIKSLLIVQN